jgi:hypothetical protein
VPARAKKDDHVERILEQRRAVEKLERELIESRIKYRLLVLDAYKHGHSQRSLGLELDVSYQRIQELIAEARNLAKDKDRYPRT